MVGALPFVGLHGQEKLIRGTPCSHPTLWTTLLSVLLARCLANHCADQQVCGQWICEAVPALHDSTDT